MNYGVGYTDAGTAQMTLDELLWHVKQLSEKLKKENEARQAAMDRAAKERANQQYRMRRKP